MTKANAIMHYTAAISIFKKWVVEEIISQEEYFLIEENIAQKYRFPPNSIYRSIPATGSMITGL